MIHKITTYKELEQWSRAFTHDTTGEFGLLFLVGDPGHGKSFTLRKLVNDQVAIARKKAADLASKRKKPINTAVMPVTGQARPMNHRGEPLWLEGGSVSAFMLYQKVYEHLDEMVILDDVDAVYSDRSLVRLLKSVCQTEKIKEISWTTANKQLVDAGIPGSYKCRSRVAIIANHWKELNQHVASLNSRGIMLEFAPSIQEVFKYVKDNEIIKDADILDFVQKNLWLAQKIDIRDFKNASMVKKSKLPWKDAISTSLGIRELLCVHQMSKDTSFNTEEERATKFKAVTNLSRPMYFKYRDKLDAIKSEIASAKGTSHKQKQGQIA